VSRVTARADYFKADYDMIALFFVRSNTDGYLALSNARATTKNNENKLLKQIRTISLRKTGSSHGIRKGQSSPLMLRQEMWRNCRMHLTKYHEAEDVSCECRRQIICRKKGVLAYCTSSLA